MAKQLEFVGIYMEAKMKKALQEIADSEDRSVGSLIRRLVEQEIAAREAKKAEAV